MKKTPLPKTSFPKPKLLKVMISSRCADEIDGVQLSKIRKKIKDSIESETLFGEKIYEVWTNEDGLPAPNNSWDECLQRVKEADIVIVLYNGNSGWGRNGTIGICHEEFNTAIREAPGKVRLIWLFPRDKYKEQIEIVLGKDDILKNTSFLNDVNKQNLFSTIALNQADLLSQISSLMADVTTQLAKYGVKHVSRGKRDRGEALDWSKLGLFERAEAMRKSVAQRMIFGKAKSIGDNLFSLPLEKENYLIKVHAVPASMSIGTAREMVGQPFLRDHLIWAAFSKQGKGPIHVIACHQTATEAQAIKQLGTPDATVISGNFGIYIADETQKIQMVFLNNCCDHSATIRAVDDFFDWAREVNELDMICERAQKRWSILEIINKVNSH